MMSPVPQSVARFACLLRCLLATAVVSGTAPAARGQAFLVKDIAASATIESSEPRNFLSMGEVTFFAASTPQSGTELWRTDGTMSGTAMVKDINPGATGSYPRFLTNAAGRLFFTADDGTAGEEIWTSDGTEAGTHLVRDIRRGSPAGVLAFHPLALGNMLLFFADDGATGQNLWRSDGTADGTAPVTAFRYGALVYDPRPTVAGGALYFAAPDGLLWKTDGRSAKLVVTDPDRPFIASGVLTALGDWLLFSGRYGLWRTDGTDAGTEQLAPVADFRPLIADGSRLLFVANDGNGPALWASDGSAGGTMLIRAGFYDGDASSAVLDGVMFLLDGGGGLWRTDGTAPGTTFVTDQFSYAANLAAFDHSLFFQADDNARGGELWKSDGTAAGTVLLSDIRPGPEPSSPAFFTEANGTLLFAADDGVHGAELWRSDGTAAGTVLVKNIAEETGVSSNPSFLKNLDETLVFVADDVNGRGLWHSDGTADGTTRVATGTLYPIDQVGRWALFAARESERLQIWASEGTETDPILVFDGPYQSPFGPDLPHWTAGGTLYFFAGSAAEGFGLWKADGRTGRASLVKAIAPPPAPGPPRIFVYEVADVDGTIFFALANGGSTELWKSNGTASGTKPVRAFLGLPVTPSRGLRNLTALDDSLFFTADRALWKSDGREAGTVVVRDGIDPQSLVAVTDLILSIAVVDGHGVLLRSDGTAGGTRPIEHAPVPLTLDPWGVVGGSAFFVTDDGVHGRELWKSDGSEAGTLLVRDINPGPGGSNPTALSRIGNHLIFNACEPLAGCEVWQSDGTGAGTFRRADVVPGAGSSNPDGFTSTGSFLFFAADGASVGRELWAISLACGGDCDGEGTVTIDELLVLVNLALDGGDPSRCLAGDANGDGRIGINEIVAAVNRALDGCAE